MIGSDDFLIIKRGLLKANEVQPGTSILGSIIGSGKTSWSEVSEIETCEEEAFRIFGDQSEFTLFKDSMVITNSGPTYLYDDIKNDNIYDLNYRIEKVPIPNNQLESDKSEENQYGISIPDYIFTTLGFLVRRVPSTKLLTVILQKNKFQEIKKMIEIPVTFYEGVHLDWLLIKSDKLKSFVDEYWVAPHIIPKILRTTGLRNIKNFCWGANSVCSNETSIGKCFKTYVHERDIRLLMMHTLAFNDKGYKLSPEPIYKPDEIDIQPLDYQPIHNKIRAKKIIKKAKGVKITSVENNWAPVVNLSIID